MSESFTSAVGRVAYGKYIDQIQEELKSILSQVGPGRTPQEVETTQVRLQELLRKQSKELAKELGLSGSHVLVFMAANAIISTAWISFALRRETSDLSKSPEDRLALLEMLDSLSMALQRVTEAAVRHADMSQSKG
jgi:antitoxin component of RelBE/YafQ-DinJ toxin-antitoxin module